MPIFLNRAATQSRFPAPSVVIGTTFTIGNKTAVVLGFAPEYADDLPGEVDAWIFEDARGMAALASQRFPYGYMAAKLRSNFNEEESEPLLTLSVGDGATDEVYANLLSSIAHRHRRETLLNFIHSSILACLVLPFLLSIFPCPPAVLKKLSWKDRVHPRQFLIAKVVSLFPPIYCGSLLLSRIDAYGSRDSAWALQGVDLRICNHRSSLVPPGSITTLPAMPLQSRSPCSRGRIVAKFFIVERYGTYVHRWAWAATRA